MLTYPISGTLWNIFKHTKNKYSWILTHVSDSLQEVDNSAMLLNVEWVTYWKKMWKSNGLLIEKNCEFFSKSLKENTRYFQYCESETGDLCPAAFLGWEHHYSFVCTLVPWGWTWEAKNWELISPAGQIFLTYPSIFTYRCGLIPSQWFFEPHVSILEMHIHVISDMFQTALKKRIPSFANKW